MTFRLLLLIALGHALRAQQACEPFTLCLSMEVINSLDRNGYPDLSVAVSSTTVLGIDNGRIELRGRTGALTTSRYTREFFGPVRPRTGPSSVTDPHAIFDPGSGRFFVVEAEVDAGCITGCTYLYLLAVSKDSSPSTLDETNWYFYSFDRGLDITTSGARQTEDRGDYDRLSIAGNALAISADMSGRDYSPRPYKLRILDKSPLLSGLPPQQWRDYRDISGTVARNFGASDRFFVVNMVPSGLDITGIVDPLSQARIDRRFVPIESLNPGPGRQLGSGIRIMSLTGPKTSPVYRDGNLWVVRPITTPSGNAASGLLWMQLDLTRWPEAPRLVQSGLLAEAGIHYYCPELMVDSARNVVITYSRSSDSEYPSAWYTWRRASDPQGTLRSSVLLRAGEGPFVMGASGGVARFSDYNGTTLDPSGDSAWMMTLWATPNTRGAWLSRFAFQRIEPPPPAISRDAIRDTASGRALVAGGAFISIFGSGFAQSATDWSQAIGPETRALPTRLNGVEVRVGNMGAVIHYAGPTQINALLPPNTQLGAATMVEVVSATGSARATVAVQPVLPGFFTTRKGTRDYAVVLRPVKAGGTLELYASGLGPTDPPYPPGEILSTYYPLREPGRMRVDIGGKAAEILFVGLVAPGLYQINVRLPEVAAGDQAVAITLDGVASQPNVFLEVAP
ncbi:MAG: hypothetical protein FJW20_22485 [Acidimicrobiia bacterium]|nr:hypothetical protein [Acidimicrobiia bacterium]